MSENPTPKTLLVIDDDPSILQLMQLLLGPLVTEMWTSLDPNEGLRLAIMHQPSLILLDNHMDEMLGVHVLEKLRKIPATAGIPVIMMTADSSIETVKRASAQDLQGYLLKPCDPDLLIETLSPWLGLAQELPCRELCARLDLSPEQAHQLEMRSLLQVLAVLEHELNLLVVGARNSDLLTLSLGQIQSFQRALSQPPPRLELFSQFSEFETGLFGQLALFWARYPELAQQQRSRSEHNLRSLFRHLGERAAAFMLRIGDPFGWQYLPRKQVFAELVYPLEAAGNNSLAHYPTDYAHLESLPEQYAVSVEIQGPKPESVYLPLVLLELLRDLAGYAYHQTPVGGELRLKLLQTNELFTLSVADSGVGLTLEQLRTQSESGPEDPALLKALLVTRQLNGRIWLASRSGEGTEIKLEIPLPGPDSVFHSAL